jgi:hypothetical protein
MRSPARAERPERFAPSPTHPETDGVGHYRPGLMRCSSSRGDRPKSRFASGGSTHDPPVLGGSATAATARNDSRPLASAEGPSHPPEGFASRACMRRGGPERPDQPLRRRQHASAPTRTAVAVAGATSGRQPSELLRADAGWTPIDAPSTRPRDVRTGGAPPAGRKVTRSRRASTWTSTGSSSRSDL